MGCLSTACSTRSSLSFPSLSRSRVLGVSLYRIATTPLLGSRRIVQRFMPGSSSSTTPAAVPEPVPIPVPIRRRPVFPDEWSYLPLSPSDVNLSNTLPVGQSFLWHRHTIPNHSSSSGSSSSGEVGEQEEEFSRVVLDPPRVVLLRQSRRLRRIYYTGIHPSDGAEEQDRREGITKRWLEDYLQLNKVADLPGLYTEWAERDPGLFGRAVPVPKNFDMDMDKDFGGGRGEGIRVLRQDPWECLIA